MLVVKGDLGFLDLDPQIRDLGPDLLFQSLIEGQGLRLLVKKVQGVPVYGRSPSQRWR